MDVVTGLLLGRYRPILLLLLTDLEADGVVLFLLLLLVVVDADDGGGDATKPGKVRYRGGAIVMVVAVVGFG